MIGGSFRNKNNLLKRFEASSLCFDVYTDLVVRCPFVHLRLTDLATNSLPPWAITGNAVVVIVVVLVVNEVVIIDDNDDGSEVAVVDDDVTLDRAKPNWFELYALLLPW